MSSISFFTPVTFSAPNKAISQRALEVVDEYFYLGSKTPRVTILAPHAERPQQTLCNYQGRYRSWTNVALKVASYCTVILPLIALCLKGVLRAYWQISSLQLQEGSAPTSKLEAARIPAEVLGNIGLFLSARDESSLAAAARFTSNAIRKAHQQFAPLKAEILALPAGAIPHKTLQELLVRLVSSRFIGHPEHWTPLLEALMEHTKFDHKTHTGFIQTHALFADLLATSEQRLSSDQLCKFYKHLADKSLGYWAPWVGYRVFACYLKHPELDPPSLLKVLRGYLSKKADCIQINIRRILLLPEQQRLNYCEIDIDPRQWFGWDVSPYSLWEQNEPKEGKARSIPSLLLTAVWRRIQSLHDSHPGFPCMVVMCGRSEANPPQSFVLPLAQRITNSGTFLKSNLVDRERLEEGSRKYARSIRLLNNQELEGLGRDHPEAVIF